MENYEETSGIIMFNRGERMLVRILVALYSLRKHYSGNVTFYVENPCPCPRELDEVLKYFNCNIVQLEERHDFKTLIRNIYKKRIACLIVMHYLITLLCHLP